MMAAIALPPTPEVPPVAVPFAPAGPATPAVPMRRPLTQDQLEEALSAYAVGALRALHAQLAVLSDPVYLQKQPVNALGIAHAVIVDKVKVIGRPQAEPGGQGRRSGRPGGAHGAAHGAAAVALGSPGVPAVPAVPAEEV